MVTFALSLASLKVPEDKSPAERVVSSARLEPVLFIFVQSMAAAALMSALIIESLVTSAESMLGPSSETLALKALSATLPAVEMVSSLESAMEPARSALVTLPARLSLA